MSQSQKQSIYHAHRKDRFKKLVQSSVPAVSIYLLLAWLSQFMKNSSGEHEGTSDYLSLVIIPLAAAIFHFCAIVSCLISNIWPKRISFSLYQLKRMSECMYISIFGLSIFVGISFSRLHLAKGITCESQLSSDLGIYANVVILGLGAMTFLGIPDSMVFIYGTFMAAFTVFLMVVVQQNQIRCVLSTVCVSCFAGMLFHQWHITEASLLLGKSQKPSLSITHSTPLALPTANTREFQMEVMAAVGMVTVNLKGMLQWIQVQLENSTVSIQNGVETDADFDRRDRDRNIITMEEYRRNLIANVGVIDETIQLCDALTAVFAPFEEGSQRKEFGFGELLQTVIAILEAKAGLALPLFFEEDSAEVFIPGNRRIFELVLFLLCLGPCMEPTRCISFVNCSREKKSWCINIRICIDNQSSGNSKLYYSNTKSGASKRKPLAPLASNGLELERMAAAIRNYLVPRDNRDGHTISLNLRWQMLERWADRICKQHLNSSLFFPQEETSEGNVRILTRKLYIPEVITMDGARDYTHHQIHTMFVRQSWVLIEYNNNSNNSINELSYKLSHLRVPFKSLSAITIGDSSANNNSIKYSVCVLHEKLLSKLTNTLLQDIVNCASCVLVISDRNTSIGDINTHYNMQFTDTISETASLEEVFQCVQKLTSRQPPRLSFGDSSNLSQQPQQGGGKFEEPLSANKDMIRRWKDLLDLVSHTAAGMKKKPSSGATSSYKSASSGDSLSSLPKSARQIQTLHNNNISPEQQQQQAHNRHDEEQQKPKQHLGESGENGSTVTVLSSEPSASEELQEQAASVISSPFAVTAQKSARSGGSTAQAKSSNKAAADFSVWDNMIASMEICKQRLEKVGEDDLDLLTTSVNSAAAAATAALHASTKRSVKSIGDILPLRHRFKDLLQKERFTDIRQCCDQLSVASAVCGLAKLNCCMTILAEVIDALSPMIRLYRGSNVLTSGTSSSEAAAIPAFVSISTSLVGPASTVTADSIPVSASSSAYRAQLDFKPLPEEMKVDASGYNSSEHAADKPLTARHNNIKKMGVSEVLNACIIDFIDAVEVLIWDMALSLRE